MLEGIQHHFNIVRTRATKHVIKKFANELDLVYFGHVDQHSDEHELIRGVTVSAEHHDSHYCVGSLYEFDISVVQRTDTLHYPGKQPKHHTWIIMQFDLHTTIDFCFPHLFLDGKNHSETFYANLFIKYRHLHKIDSSLFAGHESSFVNNFITYMPLDETHLIAHILTPDVTATLGHRYKQFDFEIFDDRLLIYANNTVASRRVLDNMSRAGLWFSRHLDQISASNRM